MSPQLAFALLLGLVFGIMAVVVGGSMGFSMWGVAVTTFVFTALTYLSLDFYEHFFTGQ